jgi:hypothetical protein
VIYAIVTLLALSGLARAARTACRDYPADTMFVRWFRKSDRLMRWYEGGNKIYDPRWLWSADFFHWSTLVEKFAWRVSGAFLFFTDIPTVVLYALCAGIIEGRFFVLGYHNLFVADETLRVYWPSRSILRDTFIFWNQENY